jgi:hypothetical protein
MKNKTKTISLSSFIRWLISAIGSGTGRQWRNNGEDAAAGEQFSKGLYHIVAGFFVWPVKAMVVYCPVLQEKCAVRQGRLLGQAFSRRIGVWKRLSLQQGL